MRKLTAEAFWAKYDKPASGDGCWIWKFCLSKDGYGKCLFMGEQLAHRAAYRLAIGRIPKRKCVLHSCDNRRCGNPSHLFIGTRRMNNRDRDQKGRTALGDRHGSRTRPDRVPRGHSHSRAKLTDADIRRIRRLYASGRFTHRALGVIYDVSHSEIGHVVRKEIRKDA